MPLWVLIALGALAVIGMTGLAISRRAEYYRMEEERRSRRVLSDLAKEYGPVLISKGLTVSVHLPLRRVYVQLRSLQVESTVKFNLRRGEDDKYTLFWAVSADEDEAVYINRPWLQRVLDSLRACDVERVSRELEELDRITREAKAEKRRAVQVQQ